MAFCKNCGTALTENAAFCAGCGAKLEPEQPKTTFCSGCGAPRTDASAFCPNCGTAFGAAPAAAPKANSGYLNGQDKITMALLCFFLGGIGIHNFMLGETKKGVFKIVMSCCFGIGAILALIDFVKILTDKYEINTEKLI